MKRLLLGLLCLCLSFALLAAGPSEVRKRAEASLLVSGSIVVATDGSVSDYAIDQPDQLPSGVVELIQKTSASWHFAPVLVDGKPTSAKAKMSLRVIAKALDDGNYAISIRSAYFGGDEAPGTTISEEHMSIPVYPKDAAGDGVSGTVYLGLLINRQGKVEKVAAEQVNLNVVDNDAGMNRWRRLLADAAISAARQWTFKLPTSGPHAHDDHWGARIPANFVLAGKGDPLSAKYGKWSVYIPGPVQSIPWFESGSQIDMDAIPDGQLAQVGNGLQLLTPVGGS